MPLFECDQCHCVENTALGNYWMPHAYKDGPVQCSECETGKWHGKFDKKPAAGMLIDQSGHLWSQGEIDAGHLPKHYKIVGKVKLSEPPKHSEE